jgi:hypothetical protein
MSRFFEMLRRWLMSLVGDDALSREFARDYQVQQIAFDPVEEIQQHQLRLR